MKHLKAASIAAFFSLLLLLFFTTTASATNSISASSCAHTQGSVNFSQCIQPGDLSQQYLAMLFGDMGDLLAGESRGISNNLMSKLFNIFNIIILTIGSTVIMYTTIVSTINTAQEGEVMGRKWSSIWIPLRSVAGVSFLVPLGHGYSFIQILVMWVVLQGVGAANALWGVVLDFAKTGQSINQPMQVDIPYLNIQIEAMLHSMICMEYVNQDPSALSTLGDSVIIYPTMVTGNQSPPITTYKYNVGIPGGEYESVCGSIQLPTNREGNSDTDNEITPEVMNSLKSVYRYLNVAAEDALLPPSSYSMGGVIDHAVGMYKSNMNNIAHSVAPADSKTADIYQHAKNNGWMTAGSYYSKLIESSSQVSSIFLSIPPITEEPESKHAWSGTVSDIYQQFKTYTNDNGPPKSTLSLGASGAGGAAASAFAQPFIDLALSFMNMMTNSNADPMVSIQNFGSNIVLTVEGIWMGGMMLLFVALFLGYIQSWANPVGWAITALIDIALPVINLLLAFLWSAGIGMGIYLPLVPYVVFTFAAMSWMLTVFETVVASPIVALGLTAPSEDHLGKASSALVLIASVFLRPGLMVIGFVAASRLYIAVMQMLQFSIAAVVKSQISGIGLFGAIGLIALYGSLAISIAHKCFTLIYVIPDRVMRWIGGQAESSNVANMEQQARRGSETGAKISGELAKGGATGLSQLNDKTQDAFNKGKSKENARLNKDTPPPVDRTNKPKDPPTPAGDSPPPLPPRGPNMPPAQPLPPSPPNMDRSNKPTLGPNVDRTTKPTDPTSSAPTPPTPISPVTSTMPVSTQDAPNGLSGIRGTHASIKSAFRDAMDAAQGTTHDQKAPTAGPATADRNLGPALVPTPEPSGTSLPPPLPPPQPPAPAQPPPLPVGVPGTPDAPSAGGIEEIYENISRPPPPPPLPPKRGSDK